MNEALKDTYYTNVAVRGQNVFLRYIMNGERKKMKIPYKPSLYLPCGENDVPVMEGLRGEPLKEVKFESIKATKEFLEAYKDLDNFKIFGSDNFATSFIANNFNHEKDIDESKIRIVNFDIEVFSGERGANGEIIEGPGPWVEGYMENAEYPITAITIYDNFTNTYHTWGLHEHCGIEYKYDPNHEKIGGLTVDYRPFNDEHLLLVDFLEFWQSCEFDIITGYNVELFDIPYIYQRVCTLFEEKAAKALNSKLSPWGIVTKKTKKDAWGNDKIFIKIFGMEILDYMDLYKKLTHHPMEGYKLNQVAEYELKEKKLDYSEARSLNTLYLTDYQKYIDYNIQDVRLVLRLIKKTGLMGLAIRMAYDTSSNYQDILGTVKPVYNILYCRLFADKKVPMIKHIYQGSIDFGGAFVKEPVPGLYEYIISADLASLYPHIMQMLYIGNANIVEPHEIPADLVDLVASVTIEKMINKELDMTPLKKYPHLILAPNGVLYRCDIPSVFRDFTLDFYGRRKVIKTAMKIHKQERVDLEVVLKESGIDIKKIGDENKDFIGNKDVDNFIELNEIINIENNDQMSKKILPNSSYGAVTNRYLRDFFDVRMGASITATGQVINRFVAKKTSEFINTYLGNEPNAKDYVITMDTDSFYATMKDIVIHHGKENLNYNDVCDWMDDWYNEHIKPKVVGWCEEMADYMNAPENRMFYEREKIAISGIFKGKKRYTLAVIDDEGVRYPEPEIKVTGLESVTSTTPKWSREILKKCYKVALLQTEGDMHNMFISVKKEFDNYPVEKIAQNKKIGVLNEYFCERGFMKGTPAQVKATLTHNRMIEELNVPIAPIISGDGVKILLLETPNPTKINDRIAFMDYLPPEFGLEKYVDKHQVWVKSFEDPLQSFLDCVGWSTKKRINLFNM